MNAHRLGSGTADNGGEACAAELAARGALPSVVVNLKAHKLYQALNNCQDLLRDLQEVLFLTDTAGRWRFLSPSWTALLGHDVQASLGLRAWCHVLAEDRSRHRLLLRSMLQGRQETVQYEFRCRARDGSVRWIEVRAKPLLDGDGSVAGVSGTLRDTTARRESLARQILAAAVIDCSHNCVVITDAHARILEVNDAFTVHTGYTREQAIGRTPAMLASGRHAKDFYRRMWTSLLHHGQWSGEVWNRRADGELIAEQVQIRAVCPHDSSAPLHFVAVYSDITSFKRQQEDFARLAHYDALTKLPNRALMLDRLGQLMAQAEQQGQALSVCRLDLDDFKLANDVFGHKYGDALLLEVSKRLSHVLRSTDTVARLDGDEFVLLLGGTGSMAALEPMLQRVHAALGELYVVEGQHTHLTASMGVALYPQHGRTPEHLLRAADQAMYRAKRLGKNRTCIAGDDADRPPAEAALLEEFQLALATGQLCLHYQPKVCARTGQLLGAEALVRWQHPRLGLLAPGAFLPAVANTPLETELDWWVMRAAAQQLARWREQGCSLQLSINIAPRTLLVRELADTLDAILRETQRDTPAQLGGIELEVVESAALADLETAIHAMKACARHGLSFALDDFGTGYSSLSYLRQLPVSTLKIDRSFVINMLADQGDLHIVRAVISLAEAFGVRTVAEGVETAEHARVLAELGCHELQGYGIARPMPAHALQAWMEQRSPVPR
jgi:diguanylate cyclase (GGDEF)-like protein/PAS domain S-box-containing protein